MASLAIAHRTALRACAGAARSPLAAVADHLGFACTRCTKVEGVSNVQHVRYNKTQSSAQDSKETVSAQSLGVIANAQFRSANQPPGIAKLVATYASIPMERIRNFSIIAHIDHGKSTLSDKLLETVGNIWPTERGKQQVLDTLKVERERGITVHSQAASMIWHPPDGGPPYLLNLIDTPGHVDFSNEVGRALRASQGALLLVDASQSVQAQTVANYQSARDAGLKLIGCLTKIDLPTADPEPALTAMEAAFGFPQDEVIWTSAKSGAGVSEVFHAIVSKVPSPGATGARDKPLRALLFDSWYDEYRGVVCLVQIVDGTLKPGDVLISAHNGPNSKFTVQEVGLLAPSKCPVTALSAGHIGFVHSNMKDVRHARVGDTFVRMDAPQPPLAGFTPQKPMVFASLYPVDSGDFNALVTAVDRLLLNDASVTVERESSGSLGNGLRCGFLGLLHMDVFNQRLQDEFATPVIITAPMVSYRIKMLDGGERTVERPGDFPSPFLVESFAEPVAHVTIMTPSDFVSPLMQLLADRRGVQQDVVYLSNNAAAAAAAVDAAHAMQSAAAEAAGGVQEAVRGAPEAEEDTDEDDDNDEEDDDEESEGKGSSPSTSRTISPSPSSSASRHTSLALSNDRVVLKYAVPWAEVVTSLYDQVKSLSAGYASLDWTMAGYQPADIVKVDILVNTKPVDALSFVAHKDKAGGEGRRVAAKLKTVISRQQFEIVIQAAVGAKILAKERIPPFRKDVLTKSGKTVGGGDKSRKEKLLSKQREGKRRMKTVGNVRIPQEAFHAIMSAK